MLQRYSRQSTSQVPGWIGVDVGTSMLKMAQVEKAARGWRLVAAQSIPCSLIRTADETGEASFHPDEVETAARTALAAASGFRGRKSACLLSMSATPLRNIEVPDGHLAGASSRTSLENQDGSPGLVRGENKPAGHRPHGGRRADEELREMIAQELALDASVGFEEVEFDFWPFGHRPDRGPTARADDGGNQMTRTFSVMAVESTLAGDVVERLLRAGLRTEVFDGLPLALARAVHMASPGGTADAVAALDWGDSAATLTLIAGGKPVYTRVLRDCGLTNLTTAVQNALGLSRQECQQLLSSYGIPAAGNVPEGNELQEIIGDLAAAPIGVLVDELNRTLSYLRGQPAWPFPERICLFGGGATIKNIDRLLLSQTGIPAAPLRLDGAAGLSGRASSQDTPGRASNGTRASSASGRRAGGVSRRVDDSAVALFGPAIALSALGVRA